MSLHRRGLLATPLALAAVARARAAETLPSRHGSFRLSTFAEGLEHPWGGGFLPDGRLLVSERPGRARLVGPDGRVSAPLAGVPEVAAGGQGGLLDIQPAPDVATTGEVYFSAATRVAGGMLTRLYRARLAGHALTEVQPLLDAAPPQARGRNHFGGRLAFSPDGARVFLTSGDRYDHRERAQRLDDLAGKILRVACDGRIPADNPFAGRPGLRGDELNLIRPGLNYGWPEVSYGREYSGQPIAGGRTAGPGFTDPVRFWVPSVSPSGLAFAPPDAPPVWRGGLFLACLRPPGLLRLEMEGDRVAAEERLLWGSVRMRQLLFAPDGALLVLTDEPRGKILRLEAA